VTTFVVWNDGEGNSNLDPPPGVQGVHAYVTVDGPDGEGDETITIHYYTDRVNLQLEPERAQRLFEILRAAGAHPSGLGSYDIANYAIALHDELTRQVMTQ
jgi:hypothetical protein